MTIPIFYYLTFLLILSHAHSETQLHDEEHGVLMNIKEHLENPSFLSHWTLSNTSHCYWPEITCTNGSVTGLTLVNHGITQTLPPFMCDLNNLTHVDFHNNLIPGEFPTFLYKCSKLVYLDLQMNNFVGSIPDDIDKLVNLQHLNLGSTCLSGDIPESIGGLKQLRFLQLQYCLFNGTFPAENISNLFNLEFLDFSSNLVLPRYKFPSSLTRLKKLKFLHMYSSNFFGEIPETIGEMVALENLDLSRSNLTGQIPEGLFMLKNLTLLYLFNNHLYGEIPGVVEALNLTQLDLSQNNLTGKIPDDFGKLQKLTWFSLSLNKLSGEIPQSLGLLPSLTDFRVMYNNLSGTLPPDFGRYSKLEIFLVANNSFRGGLPKNLCYHGQLHNLTAYENYLSGELPQSLGNCSSLIDLKIYSNEFSGSIPRGLWTLNLSNFMVSYNKFTGELPERLSSSISRLEIDHNQFYGRIPSGVSSWTNVVVFKASENYLNGSIPKELTALPNLLILLLDQNQLTGPLPSDIISWKSLITLDLSQNKLSGHIPDSIGRLPVLSVLDLSENQFSGEVPSILPKLTNLNLSSNHLTGRVPSEFENSAFSTSFLDNSGLCADNTALNLRLCNNVGFERPTKGSSWSLPLIVCLAALALLLALSISLLIIIFHKRRRQVLDNSWKLTSFQRLNFNESNIVSSMTEQNVIGSGGFGTVYRVRVDVLGYVAVKRISSNRKLDQKLESSFRAEVKILSNIRHTNIVKLLCCLSNEDSMLLVYEYMENRSLDRWLHNKSNSSSAVSGSVHHSVLDWPKRLHIAIGVAHGLCYMHHDCSPPIVHRDVKSSNILLDAQFNAKVADFGLARTLMNPGELATMSAVIGSFGYMAPEYVQTKRVSEKIDVFSFGVILLELTTGKEANYGDEHSSLAEWASRHVLVGSEIEELLDSDFMETSYKNEMCSVFKLGVLCTSTLAANRPSMKEVLHVLLRCGEGFAFGEGNVRQYDAAVPFLKTKFDAVHTDTDTDNTLQTTKNSITQMELFTTSSCLKLLCHSLMILFLFLTHANSQSQLYNQESAVLLRIKQYLENPSFLSHWTSSNISHCSWREITCTNGSVTGLTLANSTIDQTIPSFLCDLNNLTHVDFYNNLIPGEFPTSLYKCSKLEYLDLSQNNFVGSIPHDIDTLVNLKYLNLGYTNFSGDIPASIGSLNELRILELPSCLFNGTFPAEIGNLSNLETLDLSSNIFPPSRLHDDWTRLNKLKVFYMYGSNLVGEIPQTIGDMVALEILDISQNRLSGQIPSGLFMLKNLSGMFLSRNTLSGEIPDVVEALNLTIIDLTENGISGNIPDGFGKLQKLTGLALSVNNLQGAIPQGIGLLPSLVDFKVFSNNLSGTLPSDFGRYSNLKTFFVSNNSFRGKLPENLCYNGHLLNISVYQNHLSGELPQSLGNCSSLIDLKIFSNEFSGSIPSGLWTFNLSNFMVSYNKFTGELPERLSSSISRLEIDHNQFYGRIPSGVSSWTNVVVFKASENYLNGSIPKELTALPNLLILLLDQNQLTGPLPSDIISWKSLITLDLSQNKLSGHIPDSIGHLPVLSELDLSENQFSGEVPSILPKITNLNLSSNHLTGRVPSEFENSAFSTSFLDNSGLCADNTALNLRPCNSSPQRQSKDSSLSLALIVSLVVVTCFLSLLALLLIIKFYRKRKQRLDSSWKLISFQRLSFTESNIVSSLTEHNMIGSGGYGAVYRVALDGLGYVAVKKIWEDKKLDKNLESSFHTEVKILSNIRHRNIVKLMCYITNEDTMLLVYEYVENRSLDRWLHRKNKPSAVSDPVHHVVLDWPRRLNIAIGTAQGLSYMHHECSPPIVHRDVKTSNILLDSQFNAKVADFGLARMLMKPGELATMSAVIGSFGYMAPEYVQTTRVSEKIDVFSYGVILLELTTGKEANYGDEHSSLAEWAWRHHRLGSNIEELLDKEVMETSYLDGMCKVFKLGVMCTATLAASRPSMKDVLRVLISLDESFPKGESNISHHDEVPLLRNSKREHKLDSHSVLYDQEHAVLLRIKQYLENPSFLSHWTSSNISHCSWREITCTNDSVTGLTLANSNIDKTIPSFLCDLKNLTHVDFNNNFIPGEFPTSLYKCSKLEYLNLSMNNFVGNIHHDIDNLVNLKYLNLGYTNFSGDIPASIGRLNELRILALPFCLFNGTFPAEIGNLSNLETLDLSSNIFPPSRLHDDWTRLNKLKVFYMFGSNLIGEIPQTIGDMVALEILDISKNRLSGQIPSGLFMLKNLSKLYLYRNSLHGEIPGVVEAFNLTELDLSENILSGNIPDGLGKLNNLTFLSLSMNQLFGKVPESIGRLPALTDFLVFFNNLSGTLPLDFGKFSKLETFQVASNSFTGRLPENLCYYGRLVGLTAYNNNLSGELPESLGSCSSLQYLRVDNNELTGNIPSGLWTSMHLSTFRINENKFTGQLPERLTGYLSDLAISYNQFSGGIPHGVSSWKNVVVFNASNNLFNGSIPLELTSLPKLTTLLLDQNQLTGPLPSDIISWKSLITLNLSHNQLSGEIPDAIAQLPALNVLDFSENKISGQIPLQLALKQLTNLNLSSNHLTGRIPSEFENLVYARSFLNNSGLCADTTTVLNLTLCNFSRPQRARIERKSASHAIIISLVVGASLLAFLSSFLMIRVYRKRKQDLKRSWKLTSFQRLSFTKGNIVSSMSEHNIIGSGGYGAVYRVAIDGLGYVAVKKIWGSRKLEQKLVSSFLAEVEILSNIRHSNIVKLLCCISNEDSLLLVYEYLENHSLDKWLHKKSKPASVSGSVLDWPKRLRIAIGAAQGLCYMHHDCLAPIVHRDVKTSNILLDSQFNAKVADFGLAKMLMRPEELATMSAVAGTFGYIAPEYAQTTRVNEKIDVYSFGVVLLELTTGKEANHGDEYSSLAEWAWQHIEIGTDVEDILDEEINEACYTDQMCNVFKIGIMCTATLPASRPSMKEVLKMLFTCSGPLNNGEKNL
ncbi:Receptor-like protein kinase HSL1, partial [Mucuna pruriens]